MNEPTKPLGETSSVWALEEVCVLLSASPESVLELVELRVRIDDRAPMLRPSAFDRQWLHWLGRGLRLQRDLGIDALAAAFISDLVEENAALERRLRLLERLAGIAPRLVRSPALRRAVQP